MSWRCWLAAAGLLLVLLGPLERVRATCHCQRSQLEVAFLLDVSGSMGAELLAVSLDLARFIHVATPATSGIRIAFVTYGNGEQCQVLPFTRSLEEMQGFLASITIGGGLELVDRALELAYDLDWSTEGKRAIVVIGDEPANDYYDPVSRQIIWGTPTSCLLADHLAARGIRVHTISTTDIGAQGIVISDGQKSRELIETLQVDLMAATDQATQRRLIDALNAAYTELANIRRAQQQEGAPLDLRLESLVAVARRGRGEALHLPDGAGLGDHLLGLMLGHIPATPTGPGAGEWQNELWIGRLVPNEDDLPYHPLGAIIAAAGLGPDIDPRPLPITPEALFATPLLYLTGHEPFDLTDPELGALRLHLERGGTLVVEPCCAGDAFLASADQLCEALWQSRPTPLATDDSLLDGWPAGRELGVGLVRHGGRPVIIVLGRDLGCSLDPNPPRCVAHTAGEPGAAWEGLLQLIMRGAQ